MKIIRQAHPSSSKTFKVFARLCFTNRLWRQRLVVAGRRLNTSTVTLHSSTSTKMASFAGMPQEGRDSRCCCRRRQAASSKSVIAVGGTCQLLRPRYAHMWMAVPCHPTWKLSPGRGDRCPWNQSTPTGLELGRRPSWTMGSLGGQERFLLLTPTLLKSQHIIKGTTPFKVFLISRVQCCTHME